MQGDIDSIVFREPFLEKDVPVSTSFSPSSTCSSNTRSNTDYHSSENDSSNKLQSDDSGDVMNGPFVEFGLDSFDISDIDDIKSEPLFELSTVSFVQTIAILFSWFTSYPGISKEAFSKLLSQLHTFILPRGNKLSHSYEKALSLIKKLIIPAEQYDCCINDCIVFCNTLTNEFQDLLVCRESRYHPLSKVARKTFKYLPTAPRIKRMFSNKAMSKLLQTHLQTNVSASKVSHNHQSPYWQSLYSNDGLFSGDHRSLSLSFCTDGMNPFMILLGIIPGPKEPENFDPYLNIFTDEIEKLNGLKLYDEYKKSI